MAKKIDATLELLKRVPIFSGLSEEEFAFITPRLVARRLQAGELIFSEGDACGGLYVIERGHVRIFKTSAGGREQVLTVDGPGTSIAELPVFDGGNYPASAQAVNECNLYFFSSHDFQELCLKHPQVALKVLRVLGGRLRHLVDVIEDLSFRTVRHRLIALLVRMAKSEGTRDKNAVTMLLAANNGEIASQIGTVRELVSRNLSRLQVEGLIELENRRLQIPSLERLEAELETSEG